MTLQGSECVKTLAVQGVKGGTAWGMHNSAFKVAGCGGQVTHVSATSPPQSAYHSHIFIARVELCLADGDMKVLRRGSVLICVAKAHRSWLCK